MGSAVLVGSLLVSVVFPLRLCIMRVGVGMEEKGVVDVWRNIRGLSLALALSAA